MKMAKVMSVMSGARRATFITRLESVGRLAGDDHVKCRRMCGEIGGRGIDSLRAGSREADSMLNNVE